MVENFKVCDDLNFCLNQLVQNSQLAVAISREYARNSHLMSTSQIYCFKNSEIIYDYATSFLVRKDYLLLDKLNEFIRLSSASGLIEKWRLSITYPKRYKHEETEIAYMTLKNADAIFYLCYFHTIIHFLTFFSEKIVHKKARESNPGKIWILFEMFIDPERHFWHWK